MKILGGIFLLTLISFLSAAEEYNLFEENGKVGLKDQNGQILIPARYDALGWSNGSFSVLDKVTGYLYKGNWGLINLSAHKITKPEFTVLIPTEGFLIEARKKLKNLVRDAAGCINTSGKEVIPFEYDGVKVITLRAIVFNREGNQFKYGLIDLANKKLIPLEYKKIQSLGSLRYAVENFQNKTALYTEAGKPLTDFFVDSISSFTKNYAIIFQNRLQGLIDREGLIKLPSTFSAVEVQPGGKVRTRQLNTWMFLDGQNKVLQNLFCDSIEAIEQNLYKMNISGDIRLVSSQFKPISTIPVSSLGKFKNGKAIFKRGNKMGLLRTNGTVAVEPQFDQLIVDGYSIVGCQIQGGKRRWAIYDSLGNKKTSKFYERIERFNGKFYPVKNRNSWGALDENGKEIIACVYDSLIQSLGENVVVRFHKQFGAINLHEDWIISPQPYVLKLINEDCYLEFTNENTFLKSFSGKVIYFTNNRIDIYSNYLLEYLSSGAVWKVDLQGRIMERQVLPDLFAKIFEESEGLTAVKRDGKFGFIDSRNRLRIANRYEDCQPFSERLAAIKILGKWGYINHEDKIAIQPVYDEVTAFKKNVAIVRQKDFYGIINKAGKIILPVRYHQLYVLPNHRVVVEVNGLKGLADADGKLLVSPKFNSLQDLDNGYVIVERNKKYGLLTLEGISTIPMIYDYLSYDTFHHHYLALKKSEWTVTDIIN